ncbi:MAG: hypothetical protein QGG42_00035 [Phycisphaerae bacterium]|jgi:hypothetical protein|nr:hypothetical protein [Phycisphaerae bacterium]
MTLNVDRIRVASERPGEVELQDQTRRQMEQLLAVRTRLIHPRRVRDETQQRRIDKTTPPPPEAMNHIRPHGRLWKRWDKLRAAG